MSAYNGYTNWETWQILLWASNEEDLYEQTTTFVGWAAGLAGFPKKCATFFRAMFPMGTPDMDSEQDLDNVNWQEIAKNLEEWND